MRSNFRLFGALIPSICIIGIINAQEITSLNSQINFEMTWATNALPEFKALPESPNQDDSQLISATCFCKVAYQDLSGHSSAVFGVCLDLSGIVNMTYTLANEANQKDCASKCSDKAKLLTAEQRQSIADCACYAAAVDGTKIRAFSSVGTKNYRLAYNIGRLENTPEQSSTKCTCPSGWRSNTSSVDGGVTDDGKCYKAVCGPINSTILPPSNTLIGTWGLVRGNQIQMWGNLANGGNAICKTTIFIPKVCKL